MKSVLISIQPKWCELIASGKKTVDVRKTKPKIETPFKVYIYCTQNTPYNPVIPMRYEKEGGNIYTGGKRYAEFLTSKVIGEFVCDKIYDITPHFDTPTFPNQYICGWDYGKEFDCLSFEELTSYLNGKQGYGWHISDLVIYDKPKDLSELSRYGYGQFVPVKRPPESWCYVEELKPCPFCGGEVELKDLTSNFYGFNGYEIKCNCGCMMKSDLCSEMIFEGNKCSTPVTERAKSKALNGLCDRWNRRADNEQRAD